MDIFHIIEQAFTNTAIACVQLIIPILALIIVIRLINIAVFGGARS